MVSAAAQFNAIQEFDAAQHMSAYSHGARDKTNCRGFPSGATRDEGSLGTIKTGTHSMRSVKQKMWERGCTLLSGTRKRRRCQQHRHKRKGKTRVDPMVSAAA